MTDGNLLQPEYLVVGAGLTGATMARLLTDAGRTVTVVDRRNHVGGNVHDYVHRSGIRVHQYGPHYFRTNSDAICEYVQRFAAFHPYQASIKTLVDGQFESWPVTSEYLLRTVGPEWQPGWQGAATNFEEASLAMMPRAVYEKFVKGYSEKQWGVPAKSLSKALAGRFDVRSDNEPRLSRYRFQGIPLDGYTTMMERMLEGVPRMLDFDYLKNRTAFAPLQGLIYTGPIDEFFGFCYGRLRYRGQQRYHEFLPQTDRYQPCGQVNNPNPGAGPHIRTLEWKQMMPAGEASSIQGTLITREVPFTPSHPDSCEYPFPDEENQQLYSKYRSLADTQPGVLVCGRLGEYKYYDMDQAIGRAMMLTRKLLKEDRSEAADISDAGAATELAGATGISR